MTWLNHMTDNTADTLKDQGLREQIIKALGYKPEITYDDLTEIGIRDVARIESLIKTHQKALLTRLIEEEATTYYITIDDAITEVKEWVVPVEEIEKLMEELCTSHH